MVEGNSVSQVADVINMHPVVSWFQIQTSLSSSSAEYPINAK